MKYFNFFFLFITISVILMSSLTSIVEAGKKGDTIIIGGSGHKKGCHCDDHEDDHGFDGYGGWW